MASAADAEPIDDYSSVMDHLQEQLRGRIRRIEELRSQLALRQTIREMDDIISRLERQTADATGGTHLQVRHICGFDEVHCLMRLW